MREVPHLATGVGAGVAAICLSACDAPCQNDIIAEVASPDGKLKAVLFNRDCGATTDFSSHVSILGPGDSAVDGGNAFAADSDHDKAETGAWGGPSVDISWSSATGLTIAHAAKARIFKMESSVGGVTNSYVPEDAS